MKGKIISYRRLSLILLPVLAVFFAVEGTWCPGLPHHWTFITVIALALLALCLTSVNDFWGKSTVPLLSHTGIALVLVGGLLGAADRVDVQMQVYKGAPTELEAFDNRGNLVRMPFGVSLEDLRIDYYEDGTSPKQFTSLLSVDGSKLRTSVNHPGRYKGYRIYQYGYDPDSRQYSVLKIVRDPFLPVVALGALLLLSAALLGLKKIWRGWKVLVAALALSVVFASISIAGISFGTLVPALRSLWFIPHLTVYMLAYSILALAVFIGIASIFSKKIPDDLTGKLLSTSSSLLLIGMLCGAVWAQQSWGGYWTWDAKECWAAATWLLTLCGIHTKKKKLMLAFVVISFLAMQMTWYGVNYLPSSGQSLHTYN